MTLNKTKFKKAALGGCGLFGVAIAYVIFWRLTGIGFACPIHFLTGWHCPGCGVTRMLAALLRLDFYQAFRYNPLLFVLLPVMLGLFIEGLIAKNQDRRPLVDKIPAGWWMIIIIGILIYGVMRNLAWFEFLAPVEV